jgi:hypothetical protein
MDSADLEPQFPDVDRQWRRLRLLAELARAKAVRTAQLRAARRLVIRGLADVRRATRRWPR